MFALKCAVQSYNWGKIGPASEVFQLISSESHNQTFDVSKPYAELWMGTHPSGPATLYDGGSEHSLSDYVKNHPTCLGERVQELFGSESLPFLFKVLSVGKSLSIQAHPNKKHAELLHSKFPDLYKDDNHKPEMAIALTPFEALLAFRSLSEISMFIKGIPELSDIVGKECLTDMDAILKNNDDQAEEADHSSLAIKAAYSKIMRSEPEKISRVVNKLRDRLVKGKPLLTDTGTTDLQKLTEIYLRLSSEFPGDVGCLNLFFLNYVRLEPGQAIFLEANLPHAYLSGDCVECMACSDNVVRAGLTPKYKDVDCLLGMLNYESRNQGQLLFEGEEQCIVTIGQVHGHQPRVVSFRPLIPDFAVDFIDVPAHIRSFQLEAVPSASILLILEGSGSITQLPRTIDQKPVGPDGRNPAGLVYDALDFTRGSVIFLSSDIPCCLHQPVKRDHQELLAFRAYVNVPPVEAH